MQLWSLVELTNGWMSSPVPAKAGTGLIAHLDNPAPRACNYCVCKIYNQHGDAAQTQVSTDTDNSPCDGRVEYRIDGWNQLVAD
jgi:hypothetical protein